MGTKFNQSNIQTQNFIHDGTENIKTKKKSDKLADQFCFSLNRVKSRKILYK